MVKLFRLIAGSILPSDSCNGYYLYKRESVESISFIYNEVLTKPKRK